MSWPSWITPVRFAPRPAFSRPQCATGFTVREKFGAGPACKPFPQAGPQTMPASADSPINYYHFLLALADVNRKEFQTSSYLTK